MKILGVTGSKGAYICEVSHDELEKLFDKFYGKLPPLEVGKIINLGTGHDFRGEIKGACQAMVDASARFERARDTLTKFANMVGELPDPGKDGGQ